MLITVEDIGKRGYLYCEICGKKRKLNSVCENGCIEIYHQLIDKETVLTISIEYLLKTMVEADNILRKGIDEYKKI